MTEPAEAWLRKALTLSAGHSSDFDLNPGLRPSGRKLRPAAVLVAISGTDLLLTKRASHLKHHAGQIAFPGGKIEAEDGSAEAAALREAEEEISLPPEAVDVIGRLPEHETVTGFNVTPVLAIVRQSFQPVPEKGEVEEVFSVPISHVLNPVNFSVEHRQWLGEWRRYYVVPFGPYYIWGATARILRGLAERAQA